ncbi:MAG: helix-turn-helix transcriptional regulator [Provencibacterium sp.]|jgi:transcriptional regulator with XRE-family HTH domain|nr:helix-turn-helix transcriptional regulator [Provencibacterium sp.]
MTLGSRVKKLRRERGLTQEYLAERLHVTRQAVSKWENDRAQPSMEKLLELSALFEIPLPQLTGTAAPSAMEAVRPPKPIWKLLFFLTAALLAAVLLLWRLSVRTPSAESVSPGPVYERLSDRLLGEELSHLPDGRSVWIRLVMREGEYFTEDWEEYLPGGGIYPINYRGSYRLEVWEESGKCLDSYRLDGDFGGDPLNFPGEVDIGLFDYNWDGLPEFTIGQYGSSSILLYRLYTLGGDGTIHPSCPELIGDSSNRDAFSIVFPRRKEEEGKGFHTFWWNNAAGSMEETAYRWEAQAGQFLAAG